MIGNCPPPLPPSSFCITNPNIGLFDDIFLQKRVKGGMSVCINRFQMLTWLSWKSLPCCFVHICNPLSCYAKTLSLNSSQNACQVHSVSDTKKENLFRPGETQVLPKPLHFLAGWWAWVQREEGQSSVGRHILLPSPSPGRKPRSQGHPEGINPDLPWSAKPDWQRKVMLLCKWPCSLPE